MNNVVSPSQLQPGSNYHFFEKGVKPAWEDVRNKSGGNWTVIINERDSLQKCWLNLLLGIIGESYPHAEQITGLVVGIRSRYGDKVSLWTSHADDKETVLAIGNIIRKLVKDDAK